MSTNPRRRCLQSVVLMLFALGCCCGYEPDEIECPDKTDQEIYSPKYHVIPGVPFRAWRTLPYAVFTIRQSGIPQAGMGVFANTFIPKNTWLGEYEGEFINLEQAEQTDDFEYTWRVNTDGEVRHYVAAENSSLSNWLRFINCPRHTSEENIRMHTCYGHVMYRTYKDVAPGQELFVYYGDSYAEDNLGIDTDLFHDMDYACVLDNSCESLPPKKQEEISSQSFPFTDQGGAEAVRIEEMIYLD